MRPKFDIVILGLSVTSWGGNGHATTYRSLIRGLAARGHRILFLERDQPWYAGNRDEPNPAGATTVLYDSVDELIAKHEAAVQSAGLVIVGSFVPDGVRVAEWVTSVACGRTAFYDIDTPVTLGKLANGEHEYITPDLIPCFDLYLSFTGGPTLRHIESQYGSPAARALFCSVDTELYKPLDRTCRWDLGYLGTYSVDRQPVLESLLLEPARRWTGGRFAVVGPMYPEDIRWPANVFREIHLSPREHPAFYAEQRFTLNVTRVAMKQAGYSPSVRLFEAGACASPIISDWWHGLDSIFAIGREVLVSTGPEQTLRYLRDVRDVERLAIAAAARERVLREHTPERRAIELEGYWKEAYDNVSAPTPRRNGRGREVDHGVGAGVASERERPPAGGGAGSAAGADADPGRLHESAGKGGGNGGGSSAPARDRAASR
jgi:spore maturation protein CgeB